MNSMRSLTAAAILAGLAGSASAQMVVDADLGTLLGGTTTNISDGIADDGSIAGVGEAYLVPADNGGTGLAIRTYLAQEHVFQFTITEDSTITLTNNLSDLAADRDYVLGDGLGVTLTTLDTGDWFTSDNTFDWIDGDFGIPTEVFEGGPYAAGTYFLIMDEFTLADGTGAPGVGGAYDVDLIIDTFVPPTEPTVFTDLGIIGNSGAITTIEVCASNFDTELGIYDAVGSLLANDDDGCAPASSLDAGLPVGTYWAAVSGFNTTFGNGWVADGVGREAGDIAGNMGSAAVAQTIVADEVAFFKFEIEAGVLTPPVSTDLGDIATDADTFSIDTFGSDIDTELGLWDSDGFLLANNDDAGGTLQSELPGLNLAVGTYYFSVSGFNATFGDLFASTTTSTAVGLIVGQANGVDISGPIAAGEVQFFSFNVTADMGTCVGDIADDFGTLGSDGMVSFGDFLALLGLVGPCPGGTPGCVGDIADDFGTVNGGDGMVSFGDFLALLGLVGPCP